jgi:hypothetical protein
VIVGHVDQTGVPVIMVPVAGAPRPAVIDTGFNGDVGQSRPKWYSAAVIILNDLRALLNARPFVPFRLWLRDGAFVDVKSREVVLPGRHFALVGLLDPKATDTVFDRYMTVWYLHVTRHEMLGPGTPPFSPPTGPAESPLPAPA